MYLLQPGTHKPSHAAIWSLAASDSPFEVSLETFWLHFSNLVAKAKSPVTVDLLVWQLLGRFFPLDSIHVAGGCQTRAKPIVVLIRGN